MKLETNLTFVLALLITIAPLTTGQDVQGHPGPVPENVLGPQLIAWSQVQKPQPVERSLPPSDSPQAQPGQHPAQTVDPSRQQVPASQTPVHQSAKDNFRK